MIKTGGNFDPSEKYIYFIASGISRLKHGAPFHKYLLVPVNELGSSEQFDYVARWISEGKRVFIDSGAFDLAVKNLSNYPGMTINNLLGMSPNKLEGFDELFDRYVQIVGEIGDDAWGYVEIDIGGMENKIKIRSRLENEFNLRPIPVYHPLNDDPDYFDELAQNYDRVAIGNLAISDRETCIRLISTVWDRARAYPHLWIHLLGFTPSELLYSYPVQSGDSSNWLAPVRWAVGLEPRVCGKRFAVLPKNFRYSLDAEPEEPNGRFKAKAQSAYSSFLMQQNWQDYMVEFDDN